MIACSCVVVSFLLVTAESRRGVSFVINRLLKSASETAGFWAAAICESVMPLARSVLRSASEIPSAEAAALSSSFLKELRLAPAVGGLSEPVISQGVRPARRFAIASAWVWVSFPLLTSPASVSAIAFWKAVLTPAGGVLRLVEKWAMKSVHNGEGLAACCASTSVLARAAWGG